MRISIVTATFNKLELTQAFWESLMRYPPAVPWEMIWVDDGSTDGTRDWLRNLSNERNTVIFNEQNRGFAFNNNIGAKTALGDVLVFLNNDLILTPNWFAVMFESLSAIERIGFVGNIQIQVSTGRIDHAGVCFDLVGLPDHVLKNRSVLAAKGSGAFHRGVTAACCMIRRDVFLEIGGFDEQFRNGCEDVDLCLRLGRADYRHYVDYRSLVYHHVSSSPGRKAKEEANLARFLCKWGDETMVYGKIDWPRNYLSRHLWNPTRLNGPKFFDALARLLKFRTGDSLWAARKRSMLLAQSSSVSYP